jgi:hypothetical protein
MRGLVALALVSPGLAQNQMKLYNYCFLPVPAPTGYFYETTGSNKQQCGTMRAGDVKCDEPFMCAKGFSGTPTVTCVPAGAGIAPLTFTGCTKNKCTIPTTPVTGYTTAGLACKSLEVKGIQGEEDTVQCETPATCAPGYALDKAQKSVTAYCKTTGKDLTFSGCCPSACPAGQFSLNIGGLCCVSQTKPVKIIGGACTPNVPVNGHLGTKADKTHCPLRMASGSSCRPRCDEGYELAVDNKNEFIDTKCKDGLLIQEAECTKIGRPVRTSTGRRG